MMEAGAIGRPRAVRQGWRRRRAALRHREGPAGAARPGAGEKQGDAPHMRRRVIKHRPQRLKPRGNARPRRRRNRQAAHPRWRAQNEDTDRVGDAEGGRP